MEESYNSMLDIYNNKRLFKSIIISFSLISIILFSVGFSCYYLIPNKQNESFIVIQFGFIPIFILGVWIIVHYSLKCYLRMKCLP